MPITDNCMIRGNVSLLPKDSQTGRRAVFYVAKDSHGTSGDMNGLGDREGSSTVLELSSSDTKETLINEMVPGDGSNSNSSGGGGGCGPIRLAIIQGHTKAESTGEDNQLNADVREDDMDGRSDVVMGSVPTTAVRTRTRCQRRCCVCSSCSDDDECHCCSIISRPLALCIVFITVLLALCLAYGLQVNANTKQRILKPNMKTVPEQPRLHTEGRCFKVCEPDDMLYRDDKLMKTVVVHDGIKPTRNGLEFTLFFLYLYPNEPEFGPEVGEPLYLTEYLKNGNIEEGRERARVKGLEWPELESYAGFLTVSEKFGSHLYFWFFPSQSDPNTDPVILWLQGGPGATSLFGLFKENGPIYASVGKDKKPTGKLNRFSWNRNASVLYIDNPVGAGFSYTSTPMGYPNFVNESSEDLFIALQQFFTLFENYKERDFYIFGESYGGKYIPALSHRIRLAQQNPKEFGGPVQINLVGIGIGNGWMSPIDQGKYASYLFYHGFLDEEQYMTLVHLEDDLLVKIDNGEWFDSWMASDNQLHFILQALNYSSLYDITGGQYDPETMNFWYYMQQPHVRKAMNLGNRSMSDGLEIYKSMIEDTMQSIRPELVDAMENLKVLIYHGALDIICHFAGAQEMLAKTNWTGKDDFHASERRAVWVYNELTTQHELAGYVKGDANVKFMLLRNAGHCSPLDQPQWALRMVEAFIQGTL